MDENEIDFTPPSSIQKIKEHFTGDKTDAEVFAEKELGQLMDKELSEALLSEYLDACEKEKAAKEIKDALRAEIIALAGKDRGNIQRGKMILSIEDRAPRATADYEAFIKDSVGEKAWKELQNDIALVKIGKATCTWVKLGKPSIEVSVARVNG